MSKFITETAYFAAPSAITGRNFESGRCVITPKRCIEFYDSPRGRSSVITNWDAAEQTHVYHNLEMLDGLYAVITRSALTNELLRRHTFAKVADVKTFVRALYAGGKLNQPAAIGGHTQDAVEVAAVDLTFNDLRELPAEVYEAVRMLAAELLNCEPYLLRGLTVQAGSHLVEMVQDGRATRYGALQLCRIVNQRKADKAARGAL